MNLDAYWAAYEKTLARVRDERPATVAQLVALLNTFERPSSGLAFFGNGADDQLADALADAGWDVQFVEGDYVWDARNPVSGEWVHSIEGDIYGGPYLGPNRT